MDVRAPVTFGVDQLLSIETAEMQNPKAYKINVEIEATVLCDVDEYTLSGSKESLQAIPRHESAGLLTELGWKGSTFGGRRGGTHVPEIIVLHMEGKIKVDDLITQILPLHAIHVQTNLMARGASMRILWSTEPASLATA